MRAFLRLGGMAAALSLVTAAFPMVTRAADASFAWRELESPPVFPRGVTHHNLALDLAGRRLVVYYNGELWTMNIDPPEHWTLLEELGDAPRYRTNSATTLDTRRNRMLVIGGKFAGAATSDVFALPFEDPLTWSRIEPAGTLPPPLTDHTAVYDSLEDRVIVYGGSLGSAVWQLRLGDTPTWEVVTIPAAIAGARIDHTAIFDPVRHRMIVCDGFSANPDVYSLTFNGPSSAFWTWRSPPADHRTVSQNSGVYDARGDRMLVFGGYGHSQQTEEPLYWRDLWSYSLATNTWTRIQTAGLPVVGRYLHQAVFDPVQRAMFVVGGLEYYGGMDTYRLDLEPTPRWRRLDGQALRRGYAASAFDPVAEEMILSAGWPVEEQRRDIWRLQLAPESSEWWVPLTPIAPAPSMRYGASGIVDPVRRRFILFGGNDEQTDLNDLWSFSLEPGGGWTQLAPIGTPPSPRTYHGALYDPLRDRMIVIGGLSGSNPPCDVWALSLGEPMTWTQLMPTYSAPLRLTAGIAYDETRDRALLVGGLGPSPTNDVWALSLSHPTAWYQVQVPSPLPAARAYLTACYDPFLDAVLMFGGQGTSGQALGDLWMLRFSPGPAWEQVAPSGAAPHERIAHSAVLDPAHHRMALFGGYYVSSETGHTAWLGDAQLLEWGASGSVDVGVPAALSFGLEGILPNPGAMPLRVGFTLPDGAPASLEMLDVTGRRVARHAVGPLGPGRHLVVLAPETDVRPGIYFVRLTRGRETKVARAVIVE